MCGNYTKCVVDIIIVKLYASSTHQIDQAVNAISPVS